MTVPALAARLGSKTRKVVLVTGCSSGIGFQTARRFARGGYRVYASMRRPEAGAPLLQEAAAEGWDLHVLRLDVTDQGQVDQALAQIGGECEGRIDVLVNNAGYYLSGPIEHTSPEELAAELDTNLIGVLRMVRAVLPAMRARHRGHIINMSSVSGVVALPIVGPYNASKFALEAFTESLRYEVSPFGIRVTAIQAGPVTSAFYDNEVRAVAARDAKVSPYRGLLASYAREVEKLRRIPAARIADVIFRVARRRSPPLRVRVGPTSFSGGLLRRFVPDRIFEALVGFVFHRTARRP